MCAIVKAMVSFGYSIGDFINVGHLAWNVYKSCKDAPGSFSNIAFEVLSLHAVLREVEETLSNGGDESLSDAQSTRLSTLKDGCENVLNDLQSLIDKYESLGTKSKRTWDRLGWGLQDIADLRSRLTSNTVLLTAFISISQVTVERILNKFLQEFRDGKHEGSVVTNQTVESLSKDEKQVWHSIRKELEDIGVTVAAFEANKSFIIEWFKESIATGAFDEQESDAEPDIASSTLHIENGPGRVIQEPGYSSASQLQMEASGPLDGSNTVPLVLQKSQPTQSITSKRPMVIIKSTRDRSEDIATIEQTILDKAHGKPKRVSRLPSLLVRALGLDNGLYDAARDGNLAKVQELLRKGANIEKGKGEDSTLCVAVDMEYIEVVQLLLEKGANVNARGLLFEPALHKAAAHGQVAMVRLLLQNGANPNMAFAESGLTALHNAVINGHVATVGLLLEWGAGVNDTKNRPPYRTALHPAADMGHERSTRVLLDYGADIEARTSIGKTALLEAASGGHLAVMRLLLEKGAYIKTSDTKGWTALHDAAFHNCVMMVQLLLERSADVNAYCTGFPTSSDAGWTPLHVAAKMGHKAVVRILLEDGNADVGIHTLSFDTVLHIAARWGCHEVVRVLLQHGAEIEMMNSHGRTALHVARESGNWNAEKLLMEHGAVPTIYC